MNLSLLGWSARFADDLACLHPTCEPGRVSAEHRGGYQVISQAGELVAGVTGKFRHAAERGELDLPAVGDWVALSHAEPTRATIAGVLPRFNCIRRKAAGEGVREQVLAANVDTLFLVTALNADFNLRRLERYLALASDSGARAVLILNKADLCNDLEPKLAAARALGAFAVHPVCAVSGDGCDELKPYLHGGQTIALLGSSGVGKSTIANVLVGEERFATGAIRASDDRGKHTTTVRSLIPLPCGASLIDTPGLRELQAWADESDVDDAFGEIAELARSCRFSDCSHESEPGCAVRSALGITLDEDRLAGYQKLRREAAYLERKSDARLHKAEMDRWKKLARAGRERGRHKRL